MEKGALLKVRKKDVNYDHLVDDLVVPNPAYISDIRFKWSKTSSEPEYLQYFDEEGDYYILPRNYTQARFVELSCKERFSKGKVLNKPFKHNIHLREYQLSYIKDNGLNAGARTGESLDCVLNVPCGHGKTVLALYLTALRQVRTIIFVPTNFLAEQWESRCLEFLPEAAVLRVTPKTKPGVVNSFDLCIITLDLFNQWAEYFEEDSTIPPSSFGQVIMDESHRAGAYTYFPIVSRFPAMYRLALSATFRRSDGIHRILRHLFGKVCTMPSVFPKPHTLLWDFGLVDSDCEGYNAVLKFSAKEYELRKAFFDKWLPDHVFSKGVLGFNNLQDCAEEDLPEVTFSWEMALWRKIFRAKRNVNYSLLDTFAALNGRYVSWLIRVVHALILSGRKPLLLSRRVNILYAVAKGLRERGLEYDQVCVITGKSRKFDLATDKPDKAFCVLGISQLANEGLDIDWLDTLVISNPIKDIEQPYGRIRRVLEGKNPPLVVQPYNWSIHYNRLQNFSTKVFRENSHPPILVKSLSGWI